GSDMHQPGSGPSGFVTDHSCAKDYRQHAFELMRQFRVMLAAINAVTGEIENDGRARLLDKGMDLKLIKEVYFIEFAGDAVIGQQGLGGCTVAHGQMEDGAAGGQHSRHRPTDKTGGANHRYRQPAVDVAPFLRTWANHVRAGWCAFAGPPHSGAVMKAGVNRTPKTLEIMPIIGMCCNQMLPRRR